MKYYRTNTYKSHFSVITITCISSRLGTACTTKWGFRGGGCTRVCIFKHKLITMDINVSSPISWECSLNCAFAQHFAWFSVSEKAAYDLLAP